MKVASIPGDFALKGLIKVQGTQKWMLSDHYYFSYEDMQKSMVGPTEIKWPVEVQDGGIVYVPSTSELED